MTRHIHLKAFVFLLLVCAGHVASATEAGVVYLDLDRVLKDYEVQAVFLAEVRGFERSHVDGYMPKEKDKPDDNVFHQYSYIQIRFRVIPQKVLRGAAEIGKPTRVVFQEYDFSGLVTLKKDGSTEDTGPTDHAIISTGSGNERKGQFCQLGKQCVFFIGKPQDEEETRLLRIEHADKALVEKLESLLEKEIPATKKKSPAPTLRHVRAHPDYPLYLIPPTPEFERSRGRSNISSDAEPRWSERYFLISSGGESSWSIELGILPRSADEHIALRRDHLDYRLIRDAAGLRVYSTGWHERFAKKFLLVESGKNVLWISFLTGRNKPAVQTEIDTVVTPSLLWNADKRQSSLPWKLDAHALPPHPRRPTEASDLDDQLAEAITRQIDPEDRDRRGNADAVASLLRAGADANAAVIDHNTFGVEISLLRYAVRYCDIATCQSLIDHGAVPHPATLWQAIPYAHRDPDARPRVEADIVKLLIDAGLRDQLSHFHLQRAARFGYFEVMEVLLDSIDINTRDEQDWTVMHHVVAGFYNNADEWRSLADQLLRFEAKGRPNEKPLHARFDNYPVRQNVVEWLIERGANLNAQDKHGLTPLHLARIRGHDPVAEVLIKAGANPDIQDKKGHKPAAYKGLAKKWGFIDEGEESGAERQVPKAVDNQWNEVLISSAQPFGALAFAEHEGFLQIDGHTTRIKSWPGHVPYVYHATGDVFVLSSVDSGKKSGRLYSWKRSTKTLHRLEGQMMPISRDSQDGSVIVNNDDPLGKHGPRILAIEPDTGKLKVLWSDPPGPERYVSGLGRDDGKLFFIVHRAGSDSILALAPGSEPREIPVDFGNFDPMMIDAVRGTDVLVAQLKNAKAIAAARSADRPPPTPIYEIGCWNMDSHKSRVLGNVAGSWVATGGGLFFPGRPMMPHVKWVTAAEVKNRKPRPPYVIAETLKLVTAKP